MDLHTASSYGQFRIQWVALEPAEAQYAKADDIFLRIHASVLPHLSTGIL
jgi:hypothetical protein